MNKTIYLAIVVLLLVNGLQGRKTTRSRGSGGSSSRGTSRKSNSQSQPAPTSFSYPQASAPKPSLSGWQERPKQNSHSYPSSQTGLSGSNNAKQPISNQQSVQKSNSYPQTNTNQQSHSYPASGGLSGQTGTGGGYPQQNGGLSGTAGQAGKGVGYPQQQGGLSGGAPGYPSGAAGYPQQQGGLSGSGAGYPHQQGAGYSGVAPPPYPGNTGRAYNGGGYPNNYNHPQGAPPPYSNVGSGYGSPGSHHQGYGSPGSYHQGYGAQSPGYFGNYGRGGGGYGGVGRSSSALTGLGIAGAGVGTILTGLALWNLARSTGHRHHTVVYDNRGQPIAVTPENGTNAEADAFLSDLVNCTLTIDSGNATEVLAIPCAIATSFTPDADVNDLGANNNTADNTKCIVTVVKKSGKEYMTTIPCSTLLNSAAENNVTEPPLLNSDPDIVNGTGSVPGDLSGLNQSMARTFENTGINKTLNCTNPEPGDIRDPINDCFAVASDLTVIPLDMDITTPSAA